MNTVNRHPVVVVGAGPAGLAVARELTRRRLVPIVLEKTVEVGEVWAGHYDRLKLNTPASTSFLPGLRFPRTAGTHPSRDAVVAYLREYARRFVPSVRTGTEVTGIARAPSGRGWLVTGPGLVIEAEDVVLATGSCAVPRVPDWPGKAAFAGRLVHSSQYRNAGGFQGLSVLVAGGGNSAFDVALDAVEAGAARVTLAVRSPAHLLPQRFLGLSLHLWTIGTRRLPSWVGDGLVEVARWSAGLDKTGAFPQPKDPVSIHHRKTGIVPVANPEAIGLLKSGKVQVAAAVEAFDGSEVLLADGSRLAADVVVAATGFQRSFAGLTGGGPLPDGIHILGFRDPLTGNLREIRHEARALARNLARRLVTP